MEKFFNTPYGPLVIDDRPLSREQVTWAVETIFRLSSGMAYPDWFIDSLNWVCE